MKPGSLEKTIDRATIDLAKNSCLQLLSLSVTKYDVIISLSQIMSLGSRVWSIDIRNLNVEDVT